MSAATPAIASARSALADLRHLPALPDSAAQVVSTMTDEFATLEDVSRIIEHDPTLTARILGLANSALYGQRTEIVNVRDAILRVLGLDLTRGVALGIAVGQIFDTRRCPSFSQERFWRDSLYTAAVAAKLMRATGESQEQRGIGFTAGAVSNIGLLVLAMTEPEALQATLESQSNHRLGDALRDKLGFDHRSAGAVLAEKWGLPDVLAGVIAHTGDDTYDGPHQQVVAVVTLSGDIAKMLNGERDDLKTILRRATLLGAGDVVERLINDDSDAFDYVDELVALVAK